MTLRLCLSTDLPFRNGWFVKANLYKPYVQLLRVGFHLLIRTYPIVGTEHLLRHQGGRMAETGDQEACGWWHRWRGAYERVLSALLVCD